jgi:hypothetical protein
MRKLIRSQATKAYITKHGTWTKKMQEAAEFHDVAEAIAAKTKFSLKDVELYFAFHAKGQSEWDFTLTLR